MLQLGTCFLGESLLSLVRRFFFITCVGKDLAQNSRQPSKATAGNIVSDDPMVPLSARKTSLS